ncbi:hypothetical protein BLNAU_25210 [Blattamonas nauphoetae]|uniref:Uncharacterized protein n=1 Tax=Blattamonas nauphoetae TaxID=2049346 RepID=A0ABQ9WK90_9EUKA|nr:hypothetical protein BLNAU_25210 [Blattamonas nauphoetae]
MQIHRVQASLLGLLILLSASTDIVLSDAAVSEIACGCGLSEGEMKTILLIKETHVPVYHQAPCLCASIGPTLLQFNDAVDDYEANKFQTKLTVLLVMDTLKYTDNAIILEDTANCHHSASTQSICRTADHARLFHFNDETDHVFPSSRHSSPFGRILATPERTGGVDHQSTEHGCGEERWMLFTELLCTSTTLSTDQIEKMLLEAENDDQSRVVLSSLALSTVQLGNQGVSFSDEGQTRLLSGFTIFPVTQSLLSFISSYLLKSILADQSSLITANPSEHGLKLKQCTNPSRFLIRKMWLNLKGQVGNRRGTDKASD